MRIKEQSLLNNLSCICFNAQTSTKCQCLNAKTSYNSDRSHYTKAKTMENYCFTTLSCDIKRLESLIHTIIRLNNNSMHCKSKEIKKLIKMYKNIK